MEPNEIHALRIELNRTKDALRLEQSRAFEETALLEAPLALSRVHRAVRLAMSFLREEINAEWLKRQDDLSQPKSVRLVRLESTREHLFEADRIAQCLLAGDREAAGIAILDGAKAAIQELATKSGVQLLQGKK